MLEKEIRLVVHIQDVRGGLILASIYYRGWIFGVVRGTKGYEMV